MSFGYFTWSPRRSAAERRADAARRIRDAARRGKPMSPVVLEGRTIARTYWGKAWCDNLERYRDFAYRLERGRSYVRSGSVIDLRIAAGTIGATVSGSSLYEVAIEVDAVASQAWRAIQRDCAGSIGSRVDLLAGKLSDAVMARLCADRTGLFPAPSAIRFTCTCPDHAIMCKHVAATMYGVGARLDHAPELLFTLRRVAVDELVAAAVSGLPVARPNAAKLLAEDGLAALFGIELAASARSSGDSTVREPAARPQARGKRPRPPAPTKSGGKKVKSARERPAPRSAMKPVRARKNASRRTAK